MTSMPRRVVARLVAACLAAVCLPAMWLSGAVAASAPPSTSETAESQRATWSITPSGAESADTRAAIEHALEPGSAVRDYVTVTNLSAEPLHLQIYGHDAFTTPDGNFDLLARSGTSRGAGRWVSTGVTELDLDSRESAVVPVDIVVPPDAEPGDHAAGVVAALVSDEAGEDGVRYEVRVGTRVYLRVLGPVRPELTLDDLRARYRGSLDPRAGSLDLEYGLANTGNIRLVPETTVTVVGPWGWWSTEYAVGRLGEVLPGSRVNQWHQVPAVAAWGPLTVTVATAGAASGDQELGAVAATSVSTVVWAVPWLPLAAVLLVVAWAWWWRRRRRARRGSAPPPPEGRSGPDETPVTDPEPTEPLPRLEETAR